MANSLTLVLGGILATLISDVWQRMIMALLGGSAPRWASVGRWVAGFAAGRIYDPALKTRPSRRGEELLGWLVHYVVGIAYAGLYIVLLSAFDLTPNLWSAVTFGVVTLAAPLFFMKPCMGGGFLGRRAQHPWRGFCKTLSAHVSFGVGLWVAFGGL